MEPLIIGIIGIVLLIGAAGIRIVRPTDRVLVETFGKYSWYSGDGFKWIIPLVQRAVYVDITENMAEAQPQEIITKDKLNATVDAQVYYKVKEDEKNVKASQYNVGNYERQIINLARSTLRNIVGTMTLTECNSERSKINTELMKVLKAETHNWGIEVVRTELKEISPPENVQREMNEVVIAEQKKIAAVDLATARETEADGFKKSEIKKAEGIREKQKIEAAGEAEAITVVAKARAEAIKLEGEAAEKYFKTNAQIKKKLEVTEASLKNNTKYFIGKEGLNPMIILSDDTKGILPIPSPSRKK